MEPGGSSADAEPSLVCSRHFETQVNHVVFQVPVSDGRHRHLGQSQAGALRKNRDGNKDGATYFGLEVQVSMKGPRIKKGPK